MRPFHYAFISSGKRVLYNTIVRGGQGIQLQFQKFITKANKKIEISGHYSKMRCDKDSVRQSKDDQEHLRKTSIV